jgi:hypothetical protein
LPDRAGLYFAGVGLIEGLPGFDRTYEGLGFISQVLDLLKDCFDRFYEGLGFISQVLDLLKDCQDSIDFITTGLMEV